MHSVYTKNYELGNSYWITACGFLLPFHLIGEKHYFSRVSKSYLIFVRSHLKVEIVLFLQNHIKRYKDY